MNGPQYLTKSDYLYESIKQDILNGHLRPGERLVVADIANKYSTSPMPVREALRRLQQEGLIEITPHIGAKVTSVNLEEFHEIMIIRCELEPLAVRLAVPRLSGEKIDEMDELNRNMREAMEADDPKKFSHYNEEFHHLFYDICGNDFLINLINELWHKTERTKSIFARYPQRMYDSCQEHELVAKYAKEGNAEAASEAFRKHKLEGFFIVGRLLDQE